MDKLVLPDDVLAHAPHLLPHEQLCFEYCGRPATIEYSGRFWTLFVQIGTDLDTRQWLRELATRDLDQVHVVSTPGADFLCAISPLRDFSDCPDVSALFAEGRQS